MRNSERFETTFNRIHELLCQYANVVNTHVSFTEVLDKASDLHIIIDKHADLLKQCSKLRNAMIHRKVKQNFYIAEPHDDIVEELVEIAEILANPPLAIQYASKPVEYFETTTTVMHVLKVINSKSFSQFPIYDSNNCIGLITDGGMLRWFAEKSADVLSYDFQQAQIQEVVAFEKESNVAFISKQATIFDAQSVFQQYMENKKKLEAIIITDNGKPNSLPIGLISSWDLIKLKLRTFPLLNHT
ncbi:CBS domain-containing protein [Gracilibacillus marinus]|jgi:predicted transcriptional regulator|uniref:CBS domain-containing protein n=1 Tax=Gracilibacillus marinus TaxID=630535 RepID=A0ABV8VSW6_9BACI